MGWAQWGRFGGRGVLKGERTRWNENGRGISSGIRELGQEFCYISKTT